MELNKVQRVTTVRLAEYVKSATDYRIQFVGKHDDNKLEMLSLIHLANIFQTGADETKMATNTTPTRRALGRVHTSAT